MHKLVLSLLIFTISTSALANDHICPSLDFCHDTNPTCKVRFHPRVPVINHKDLSDKTRVPFNYHVSVSVTDVKKMYYFCLLNTDTIPFSVPFQTYMRYCGNSIVLFFASEFHTMNSVWLEQSKKLLSKEQLRMIEVRFLLFINPKLRRIGLFVNRLVDLTYERYSVTDGEKW
jgi:hypothetical protein